jgi:hypothetical protein
MQKEHNLRPDLIFFTGDAAYGHLGSDPGLRLADQYDEVDAFFEAVRKTFNPEVPKEDLFLVPGNHDVNRKSVAPGDSLWLDQQTSLETVINEIHNATQQWQHFIGRMADYGAFLGNKGYNHLLPDKNRLVYAVNRMINGVKVGIVGLNSAWSCHQDDEKGKLWFAGKWQIGSLQPQVQDSEVSIALMHHPLSWFVPHEEDQALRTRIRNDFRFHLHGHEHEGWVDAGLDGHTRIAAGACYETSDSSRNGYNFVRLDLDTHTGKVWLRQYDAIGGGWTPRVIHGRTNDQGIFVLSSLCWLPSEDGAERRGNEIPTIQHRFGSSSDVSNLKVLHRPFDLKTTVLKTIIAEQQVQVYKMRTLRAREQIRQLIIEPQPEIFRGNSKFGEVARLRAVNAIPGRASKTPNGMFQVDFADDEVLQPDQDGALLLNYTMVERVEDAFDPPGIIACQPVGSESLVIEVYFPPGWRFDRDAENRPSYELYSKDPKNGVKTVLASSAATTLDSNLQVKWYTYDFGIGDIDFFRVKIINPPQDGEINFDWKWIKPAQMSPPVQTNGR